MTKFLIDKLMPSTEVHILSGPSGSGKTTWGLQTFVLDWSKGRDILGFKSHPTPWLYISCDRSLDSVHATMERLHIQDDTFNRISAVDSGLFDFDKVLLAASCISPKPLFFYLDGFLNLLPQGIHQNDNQGVARWLASLTRICKKEGITILGTLHSPKQKADDYYENPRQRIAGGSAWAGFADTIILVEPTDADDPSQSHHRHLSILPRNHKEIHRELAFNDDGRLVEADDILKDDLLYAFLQTIKPGSTFHVERLLTVLDKVSSRAAINRELSQLETTGVIERVSRGVYRKC